MVVLQEASGERVGRRRREDNDIDDHHSFRQLSVHKALNCPEGQSAWAVAPLPGPNVRAQKIIPGRTDIRANSAGVRRTSL